VTSWGCVSAITTYYSFRAVIWLQKCRDEILEHLRGGSLKKEDQYEYNIGRLRQDRVKIPRDGKVW
jgi:hypothetical protein